MSETQTRKRQVWGIVAYAVYLILIMSVVFCAGLDYASHRNYAYSQLALACLSIFGLVWKRIVGLARNQAGISPEANNK